MTRLLGAMSTWLFLQIFTVNSSKTCSKLRIYEVNKKTKALRICVTEFDDEECIPFVESFNRSDLPYGVKPNSWSLEKPSNIDLLGLVNDESTKKQHFKIPGASVQWNSPISENAQKNLEGFLLVWETEKRRKCRLFKFNTSLIKMMMFSYDIEKLDDISTYTFTVFSLPPPDIQHKHDSRHFVRMMMSTFQKYRAETNPGYWTPSILVKTWSNGTIDVKFTLSPPEFKFTNFEILLMRRSFGMNNYYQKKNYIGEFFSLSNPEGVVRFSGLPSDEYCVQVKVNDTFRKKLGSCLCWYYDPEMLGCDARQRCCKNTCGSATTTWFYLNITESSSQDNSSINSLYTQSVNASPQSAQISLKEDVTDYKTFSLIFFVFIPVLLITLISLFICFCKKYSFFQKSPTTLKTKKIYIMSSDDHYYHIQMVESLVRFLELHCQCQIIYHQTAQDIYEFHSPYAWFISKISNSNYIIFINSVGAEKLIEAQFEKKVYSKRESKLEEVLFTECLNYLFKDDRARNKLLIICFGSTVRKSNYFPSCFNYAIPKNLPNLISKLHALNTMEQHIFSNKHPMLQYNIPNLPEGAELINAIESSIQYEKENPNWLFDNFGVQTSGQSKGPLIMFPDKHCGQLEKMISVITHDSAVSDLGLCSDSLSDFSDCDSPEPGVEKHNKNSGFIKEMEMSIYINEMEMSIYTVPIPNFNIESSRNSFHVPAMNNVYHCADFNHKSSTQWPSFAAVIIPPNNNMACDASIDAQLIDINEMS